VPAVDSRAPGVAISTLRSAVAGFCMSALQPPSVTLEEGSRMTPSQGQPILAAGGDSGCRTCEQ
jgi:hypothetical protein